MLMIKITVWALPHTKWRHYMEIITQNEKILYIGIDVHKDTYSLCCFDFFRNELSDEMTIKATTKAVIKYLEAIKKKNTRKKYSSSADTKTANRLRTLPRITKGWLWLRSYGTDNNVESRGKETGKN